MEDISVNLLDIAINSVRAEANFISLSIANDRLEDKLTITVTDNGCGMPDEFVRHLLVLEPDGRFGSGVPTFRLAAEATGGSLVITSMPDVGTSVNATFYTSHKSCPKLGDIAGVFITLVDMNPDITFSFAVGLKTETQHQNFIIDTEALKELFGTENLSEPHVSQRVKYYIEDNTEKLIKNM